VGALAGSAALVIGGKTLLSLFGMDTRPLSTQALLKEPLGRPHVNWRLNALRVLFVDDVCTIFSSLFMRLAFVMRCVAPPHLQHRPIAGCQVVGTLVRLDVHLAYCICYIQAALLSAFH